jgi:hypothetical protein
MEIIIGIFLGAIFLPLWLAVLIAPFYLIYQLYLRYATDKTPRLSLARVFSYSLLWFVIMVLTTPILPLPFFDVPFILLFGWTVGLWRFFGGFHIEPFAVAIGFLSLFLFVISLHYLLRGILKPYGKTWAFKQTFCVAGILFAVSVSGIALMAGVHEVYWIATAEEPLIDSGSARGAARRMMTTNQTKQLAIAAHTFHDEYEHLPLGGTILPNGRLGHSWGTQLLPYLEETTLYERINMEEPWTSPENRPAFETFVVPFQSLMVPRAKHHNAEGYALSFYAVNERLLPVGESVTLKSIIGGTSTTIMLGEVKGNVRAWGDPINGRDPALGINKSPYGFGGYFPGGAIIGFCDGAVRFVNENIDPDVLRALASPTENAPDIL